MRAPVCFQVQRVHSFLNCEKSIRCLFILFWSTINEENSFLVIMPHRKCANQGKESTGKYWYKKPHLFARTPYRFGKHFPHGFSTFVCCVQNIKPGDVFEQLVLEIISGISRLFFKAIMNCWGAWKCLLSSEKYKHYYLVYKIQ